jgi:hypothetical protein
MGHAVSRTSSGERSPSPWKPFNGSDALHLQTRLFVVRDEEDWYETSEEAEEAFEKYRGQVLSESQVRAESN